MLIKRISLLILVLIFSACGGGGSDSGDGSTGNNPPAQNATEFEDATALTLSNDRNDSVNIEENNLIDYFKLEVTQLGIYTLYISSYEAGTNADYAYPLLTDIHGSDELLIKRSTLNFELTSTGEEWQTTEFEVTEIGTHYFKIYRERLGVPSDKATNYMFHIEPSLSNGLVQNNDGEFNDVQSQATPRDVNVFVNDINASVNVVRNSDATDWYELKNLMVGTYTLYLETKAGTFGSQGQSLRAKIYDRYGNLHTDLSSAYSILDMDEAGEWSRKTFDILANDSYYVKVSRDYNRATPYSFKVLPSIANGYVLDTTGEPNDELVLAKILSLQDTNTTLEGSINITTITDSDDWFEFTSDVSQSVLVKFETLIGTVMGSYTVQLSIYDTNGNEIKKIPSNQFLLDQANKSTTDTVNLVNGSKYYFRVNRIYNQASSYKITIAK